MITGKTQVCGLVGDPVAHSVSPAMHNAAFAALGLDYVYLPFRVQSRYLAAAVGGARALDIKGLNVTIPHKVAVMPLLDELDPLAQRIGAVNTIVNDDGCFKGYNTDAGGFLQALARGGFAPGGKKAVVLGAGGAARAVCFALADSGVQMAILNRQQELDWAVGLAADVAAFCGNDIPALELNDNNLKTALADADLLVNATSVGMSPDDDKTPVAENLLRPGLAVFDVVYNPLKTRLLAEAGAAGTVTIGGLDMLVGQGTLAFELWTGIQPPLDIMQKAAIEALRG